MNVVGKYGNLVGTRPVLKCSNVRLGIDVIKAANDAGSFWVSALLPT